MRFRVFIIRDHEQTELLEFNGEPEIAGGFAPPYPRWLRELLDSVGVADTPIYVGVSRL